MRYNEINQLTSYVYTGEQLHILETLKPWMSGYWEKVANKKRELKNQRDVCTDQVEKERVKRKIQCLTDANIKEIKKSVMNHLLQESQQNRKCYYCEGIFYQVRGVGNPEIDHIAHKGKYHDFTFTCNNLVLACHQCNGFSKKGYIDTVSEYSNDYNSCTFSIVHPYFDVKSEHMIFDYSINIWYVQNKSEKAMKTITMFKLNDVTKVVDLANEIDMQTDNPEHRSLIENITTYLG